MSKSITKVIESDKNRGRNILLIFLGSFAAQILILYVIDGKTLIDSVYATIATLTTVGFGDVSPSSWLARLLYLPFMIAGVLMLPAAAILIYEIQQQKVRGLSKSDQKKHVVVLGGSRELTKSVVMEMDESYEICLVSELYEINPFRDRVHFVRGSPIEKETLAKANVGEAEYIIIATDDDSTTILATALARELNPAVNIIATIVSEERSGTAMTAGANHVINTDTVTGRLLASAVHEPGVVDLISDVTSSLTGHDIIEDEFPEEMHGKSIRDVIIVLKEKNEMTLLAVNREGENIVNPPLDMVIEAGDKMIVLVDAKK
jgi:voltage-gated potassium channel